MLCKINAGHNFKVTLVSEVGTLNVEYTGRVREVTISTEEHPYFDDELNAPWTKEDEDRLHSF